MRILWMVALAAVMAVACRAQDRTPSAPPGVQLVQESAPDTTLAKDWVTVYYGVVMPPARELMERTWSSDPRQVERAFCVGVVTYSVQWATDTLGRKLGREVLARIWTVDTAITSGQTQSHITSITCPPWTQAVVHTHPPATCTNDMDSTCVYGGPGAFQCQPSRDDYLFLLASSARFGVVQCGKEQFRFFWPSEYRP